MSGRAESCDHAIQRCGVRVRFENQRHTALPKREPPCRAASAAAAPLPSPAPLGAAPPPSPGPAAAAAAAGAAAAATADRGSAAWYFAKTTKIAAPPHGLQCPARRCRGGLTLHALALDAATSGHARSHLDIVHGHSAEWNLFFTPSEPVRSWRLSHGYVTDPPPQVSRGRRWDAVFAFTFATPRRRRTRDGVSTSSTAATRTTSPATP